MFFDVNLQEDFPILYDRYLGADSHIANMLQTFAQLRKQT